MAVYDIYGNSTGVYDIYGNKISDGSSSSEPSVGYVTEPQYIEVDGNSYRLAWHDEFDDRDLDKSYWNDVMFPSLVENRTQAWCDYYLKGGKLHLRIKKDAPDRFPENTSYGVAESIVMTANKNNLHITSPSYHDVNPFWGLLVQEGYWECRFKVFTARSGCHVAWWTVGIQDGLNDKNPRAEFDIYETPSHLTSYLRHGVIRWTDSNCMDQFEKGNGGGGTPLSVDFATDFHTLGFLWENGVLKWYVDGVLVDTMTGNTPQYPMVNILAAYRVLKGSSPVSGSADTTIDEDKEVIFDYIRIYKKATSESANAVHVASYTPITINGRTQTMTIDEERGCPICFPSYVYVNWSDGSRTEHWVKWQAVKDTYRTKMTNQQSFTWDGYVYGLGIDIVANVSY